MTEETYKEIKEKKSGPMRSYRCTRVSVILGSGIGRFDCTLKLRRTFRGSLETTMGKTSPTGTNLMLAMIIRQAAPHMLSIVRPSFSFC